MDLAGILREIAQTAATLVEGIGVIIVAIAILRAIWRYIITLVRRSQPFPPEALRLELGRSLALSLEFLLGADILRTAVEPTWDEIARLAAIAAIRTILNYFLQRELTAEARRQGAAQGDTAALDVPSPDDAAGPTTPSAQNVARRGEALRGEATRRDSLRREAFGNDVLRDDGAEDGVRPRRGPGRPDGR